MDSSDFLRQILFQPYLVKKTPYVRRTSPGTRMFLLTIYLPWLLNMFPYSYWALTCLAILPTYSAFMISVRQASDLPPASFRFPVTWDTLALGYILPAVGRIRDFHPLKHAPAGRTKKAPPFLPKRVGKCKFFLSFFDFFRNMIPLFLIFSFFSHKLPVTSFCVPCSPF